MSLIEVRGVSKSFGGLRPFRLKSLDVDAGDLVVIDGSDRQSAAVFTDLITGTTLPDTGSVVIAGHPTTALASQDDWLAFLDRFGIVNERVVLLDQLPVAANLAVPLTLEIDPMPAAVRKAVEAMAAEVGLDAATLDARLEHVSSEARLLVRLGRAIAHDPSILLVEHPTADLPAEQEVASFAAILQRVVDRRHLATIVITSDHRLSGSIGGRGLVWQPASGEVLERGSGWRRWFS